MKLVWNRPEVPEGEKLLDYSLWYSTANATSTNPNENLVVIKGDETQFVLRGLSADTFYRIRLAGRSGKGHGTAATIEFRTREHSESLNILLIALRMQSHLTFCVKCQMRLRNYCKLTPYLNYLSAGCASGSANHDIGFDKYEG